MNPVPSRNNADFPADDITLQFTARIWYKVSR
jgi:hypothetical protein